VQIRGCRLGGDFAPQTLHESAVFEEVHARFYVYPIEWADPLIWPVSGFQSISGLDLVLNGKPAKEFTFRQRPRFPYNGFKVVAGCTYELGVVS
jgi:hypothetical protein